MTLNIWNYNDPWEARRDLIAACVNDLRPDIIGFQEIRTDRSRSPHDQAQQITALLREDYQCVYRPAMTFEREALHEEGLAILGRWPIAGWDAVELTRDPADEADNHQRILLHAEVRTPAGALRFFNTHWSLSEQARARNAAEVRAAVARFAGNLPVVLVGDLNSLPADAGAAALFQPADSGEVLLTDAWADIHPNRPGFTHRSDRPARRIDYIALNLGGGEFGRALDVRLAFDAPSDGLFPSDHIGIIADLEMTQ